MTFFSLLSPALSRAGVVTAAVGEYPPYTSQSALWANFSTEIVVAAYQAVGFKVVLRWVPWKRAYQEAKFGKVDITFPWRREAKKEQYFWFSDVLFYSKELFYHRRDFHFSWKTLSDLQDYAVGGTETYVHVDTLRNAGLSVIVAKSEHVNIEKLYKKRIDIFPMDYRVGRYLLSTMTQDYKRNIISNDKELATTTHYVIFSKVNPERSRRLIESFNTGLSIIKTNGVYEDILNRYY